MEECLRVIQGTSRVSLGSVISHLAAVMIDWNCFQPAHQGLELKDQRRATVRASEQTGPSPVHSTCFLCGPRVCQIVLSCFLYGWAPGCSCSTQTGQVIEV